MASPAKRSLTPRLDFVGEYFKLPHIILVPRYPALVADSRRTRPAAPRIVHQRPMKKPKKVETTSRVPGAPSGRLVPVAWSEGRRFSVPIPPDEKDRLRDLRRYEVLDTSPDESLDHLAQLAARLCETPMALISLVDADRQWFKAKVGIELEETPRDLAFCAHAILKRGVFEVPDARRDERFADNPLVISDPGIRFYAGETLVTPENHAIGTLCVMDRVPRKLSAEQEAGLRVLAEQVMAQFELRRQLLESRAALRASRREVKKLRNQLNLLTSTQRKK